MNTPQSSRRASRPARQTGSARSRTNGGNGRGKSRASTKTRKQRGPLGTALKWLLIVGLLSAALGGATVAAILWHFGSDPALPAIQSIGDYEPKQVTRITARDGEVIGELFSERRSFVPYEQIPELLVNAFVSAEDADFFKHAGIDYIGIIRAMVINLRSGRARQGASTITQQVVKTFLLSPERTLKRKVQEAILASRIEQALSKEDILTLYLNQIYFGHGRYGVAEAASYYFGKELGDIHAGEAALLAGLVQAPENISPRKPKNRERAKRRQQYVLEQMVHRGYLEEAEARKWINEPIRIVKEPYPHLGEAPEWIGVARRELEALYGEDRIPTLGATVVTTLDLEVQKAALEALRSGLRGYDQRRGYGTPVRRVKADKIELELARLAKRLPRKGPKRGEDYPAIVTAVRADENQLAVDLGDWPAVVSVAPSDARYNPEDKALGARFAKGDVVRVVWSGGNSDSGPREVSLAKGPQGAVVVIEPQSREVLALVGGYDIGVADFDRSIQAKRQPGSTFKPLVYAAALATGRYTPATIVNDAPEVYNLWKPQNYKDGAFEGPVRLRHALAKSINTVAIRVMNDVGPSAVVDMVHSMGIESKLPAELSLALGSGEVSPLELTQAFATLAGAGLAMEPRTVSAIEDVLVEPVTRPAPDSEQVLTPEVAYVAVDMMKSVVEEGTGQGARSLKMPVAGKTGTSNDARDAWFVGMTPGYVVGVWVGFDDNSPLGRGEGGGKTALPVYVNLLESIGKRERSAQWPTPEGVVTVRVDRATGLRAADGASDEDSYSEVFVTGTEPAEYAPSPDEDAASDFVQDAYDDIYGGAYGSDDDAMPPEETGDTP
ncbi:penicillin-binding protein 1A [Haliangium ochraceum]|uniref:peptidoglycan glycosyltransferase n=1 Tax=Haliangium ochraceum (strain DSM 14365 / JCM 11303 / SMP-2) TaxID=502025 RepID=D0LNM4_HALO1|nr:PBP1A family penicillin-binding protein [Haliangium ochraceum]ACY16929.1 penicillin-binding protein, 1A family [Haliangium ochraceum DSM 14365]